VARSANPQADFMQPFLVVASLGREGVHIDCRLLASSRAVEILVECHIVGEEGTVAEVEPSVLQATRIILALRVGRGSITGEATSGDLGPGAVHVAHPLVIVLHTATGIPSGIGEILQEGVDAGLIRVGGGTLPGGEVAPGVRLWREEPRRVESAA